VAGRRSKGKKECNPVPMAAWEGGEKGIFVERHRLPKKKHREQRGGGGEGGRGKYLPN